jgi:hypothetical protein
VTSRIDDIISIDWYWIRTNFNSSHPKSVITINSPSH